MTVSPGDKTQKAMEEIEELAETVADLPPSDAKEIIKDLEGDK